VCRVRGVELQPQLANADGVREPGRRDKGGEARRVPGLVRSGDGKELGLAPDVAPSLFQTFARQRRANVIPVVDRIERPEAAAARADRLEGVLGRADPTGEGEG
jgi:hypothetical protein